MWKSLSTILHGSNYHQNILLNAENFFQQSIRTTYVLKRRNAPPLQKKGEDPRKLKPKHYVYDLIKQTHVEKLPNIDVILMTYVEGLGDIGDKVSVQPNYAYNKLLLPGLAVYASPENLDKYKDFTTKEKEERPSSVNALITMRILARMLLSVIMNKDTSWTLQPWHVKASFRKCGYIVPEEAIALPEKPIKGPNMDLESKEFFVTVTVNNHEKVNVRCRIHHWSTHVAERIPHVPYFFYQPSEPVFPEQAPILETLPKKPVKEANLEK